MLSNSGNAGDRPITWLTARRAQGFWLQSTISRPGSWFPSRTPRYRVSCRVPWKLDAARGPGSRRPTSPGKLPDGLGVSQRATTAGEHPDTLLTGRLLNGRNLAVQGHGHHCQDRGSGPKGHVNRRVRGGMVSLGMSSDM